MNEQTLLDSEVCERLLNNKDFLQYLNMLERDLKKETHLYLNYKNLKVGQAREDADKKEYYGGLRMLEKIINKPNKLYKGLKRYREVEASSHLKRG